MQKRVYLALRDRVCPTARVGSVGSAAGPKPEDARIVSPHGLFDRPEYQSIQNIACPRESLHSGTSLKSKICPAG